MGRLGNAEEAVQVALEQCIHASVEGTFAVGGVMIDNYDGKVICELRNQVLRATTAGVLFPHDPTAHAERQLVDWYFDSSKPSGLPDPAHVTIVTTLDPCLMCAGAILTAGFNVGVSALDQSAGINFDGRFEFPSFPIPLREQARASFGYYGVDAPISRPYSGSQKVLFSGESITPRSYLLSRAIFTESLDGVRKINNRAGIEAAGLTNPRDLPDASAIKSAFHNVCRHAFTAVSETPAVPGQEIANALVTSALSARDRGARLNSVALIDPFGNLLLCLGGCEELSPIRTAFMEATRTYARLRWSLMGSSTDEIRREAMSTLAHPKFCTFVFLYSPDPNTPEGLMDMGAYGSTMEGPGGRIFPSNLQYVLSPSGIDARELLRLSMNLPPFYTSKVKLAPMQVLDAGLIDRCRGSMGGANAQ